MSTSLGEFMHVFPVPTYLEQLGYMCVHTRAHLHDCWEWNARPYAH